MKELLDFINSIVWDLLAKMCLFTQSTFGTKWLIILGIVFVFAAVVCFNYIVNDSKNGFPVWTLIFSFLFIFSLCINLVFMWWYGFNDYENTTTRRDLFEVLVFSTVWLLLLCTMVASVFEDVWMPTIIMVVCVIISITLFSKYGFLGLAVLGIGGGGATYIGTFTDRNGNSYDIYKK